MHTYLLLHSSIQVWSTLNGFATSKEIHSVYFKCFLVAHYLILTSESLPGIFVMYLYYMASCIPIATCVAS